MKKNYFLLLISLTCILSVNAWTGSGIAADPYLITNASDLLQLATEVNAGNNYSGRYFKLTNDIDLSVYDATYNNGKGWIPIGKGKYTYFSGHFDGNEYVIRNLFINDQTSGEEQYIGLFGNIENGSINKLKIKDANISGTEKVGTLAGKIKNSTILNSCVSESVITGNGSSLGGLVGQNFGTIKSCYVSDVVLTDLSGEEIGGLVGYNDDSAMISDCYATGTITGGEYSHVGGLVGFNDGVLLYKGTIKYSYASCSISGGYINPGNNTDYVGGLAGKNFMGNITNCFFDTEISGLTKGVGYIFGGTSDVKGKTTSQMLKKSTFAGWDFNTIWNINEDEDYPYLLMQEPLVNSVSKVKNDITFSVLVENGEIVVSNIPVGENITVYSMNGMLLYNDMSTSDELHISLSNKGLYILCVGNQNVKILN